MKVFILGVGDAFSSANYNTCFIVQSESGFNLAVECPHPYLKIMRDAQKISKGVPEIKDVNDFVITHLHSDHCSGLETLGFYKKFVDQKTLNVLLSWNDYQNHKNMMVPGMGTTLVDDKIVKVDPLDYFDYHFLTTKNPITHGPFEIQIKTNEHYIPSQALLIRDDKHILGFSGDTKFSQELISWLDQADFILHETGPAPGHAPLSDLASLPSPIRRKIRLIHYNDSLVTDKFRLANQGEIICVG